MEGSSLRPLRRIAGASNTDETLHDPSHLGGICQGTLVTQPNSFRSKPSSFPLGPRPLIFTPTPMYQARPLASSRRRREAKRPARLRLGGDQRAHGQRAT